MLQEGCDVHWGVGWIMADLAAYWIKRGFWSPAALGLNPGSVIYQLFDLKVNGAFFLFLL